MQENLHLHVINRGSMTYLVQEMIQLVALTILYELMITGRQDGLEYDGWKNRGNDGRKRRIVE